MHRRGTKVQTCYNKSTMRDLLVQPSIKEQMWGLIHRGYSSVIKMNTKHSSSSQSIRDYICNTYFFATGNETTRVMSSITGLRTRLAEWSVATGEQVTKYKLLAEIGMVYNIEVVWDFHVNCVNKRWHVNVFISRTSMRLVRSVSYHRQYTNVTINMQYSFIIRPQFS